MRIRFFSLVAWAALLKVIQSSRERRNVPWDLIEEIFSRVPAKSQSRFRSISKQWNAHLQSGSFAKKHSANAPKDEPLNIMLIDSRVCLMKINLHGIHNNIAPSVKVAYQFKLKDPLSESSQVDIYRVFHCDGLLLCTTRDKRLVVWNPCSGETKRIQLRDSHKETDCYAFGYDNKSSCKQYKILRMKYFHFVRSKKYEIYDFTSDSWRVLGVTTAWFLGLGNCGMSVKGNTYGVDLDVTSGEHPYPHFLQYFDFSAERFQSLSLPCPFLYSANLSVVREEKLCLLGTVRYSRALHVWVTTSPESVMSWSKILTLEANPEVDVYTFIDGLSFLADEQNKALVYCYDYSNHNKILHIEGGNKHIQVDPRDGNSTVRPSHPLLLNYFPSLAQIANRSRVSF